MALDRPDGKAPNGLELVLGMGYQSGTGMWRFQGVEMGWVRTVFGGLISAGYVAGLWLLLEPKLSGWGLLALNEVGDLLAGAFGPLAIFWLILGYFQQGDELKQGTRALRLQATELANSVSQQVEIVKAHQISLRNYAISVEPLLKVSCNDAGWHEGGFYCTLIVENLGEYCEELSLVVTQDSESHRPKRIDSLFSGESRKVTFHNLGDWQVFELLIKYVSRSGVRNSQGFLVQDYYDDEQNEQGFDVVKHPFLLSCL